MRRELLCAAASMGLLMTACDGPKAATSSASASASLTAAASAAPAKEHRWVKMPSLVVDQLGPSIGGKRADLSVAGGRNKLKDLVGRLPINEETITIVVMPKASIKAVSALVSELGAADARALSIKTSGRGDLPKQIALVPESRISNPEGCSVVATVTKNLSTAVWSLKGGGGKRHRKGFAGPDLSTTGATLVKRLKRCKSKNAFFTAAPNLKWEMAYNIGALIVKSDEDKKIEALVLLSEEPVGGRPVKLAQ